MIYRKLKFLLYTLALFLICSVSFAENPDRITTYPPQKIMGFRGLDTISSAPLLQDGRAVFLKNVKLSPSYDLSKRYGYSAVNDSLDDWDLTSPAITGIFDARFSDGTNKTFAFVGNKIKYDDSSDWIEVGNWWASPTITAAQNNTFQCAMALNVAICTNDVDVPIKLSSTPTKAALDVSDLSDALTKVHAVAWFRNYLLLMNTVEGAVEKPTRFRWSDVGTIETYQDDNFVDIAELGGDEIIGGVELYGNYYLFFKKAIYKVTLVGGNDIFNFDKVIQGLGSVSRDSIQVVRMADNQSAVIFSTEDKKIMLFNGLVVQDIGQIIQPSLDNLNGARLQYAVSAYDGHSYYLAVSDGSATTNDIIYEYQVDIGEWTKHLDINANSLARVRNDNQTKTYFGNYNAFVYWMDDPDQVNDVDGALGSVDSYTTSNSETETGAYTIIDSGMTTGIYTGGTIKIVSGTGVGEERVILAHTLTSLTVVTTFIGTPDTTSRYSIGAIDAAYETKWFDLGDSTRKKNFKELFLWAKEASNNEVTISYSKDFGSTIDSSDKSLAPASGSLWDSALWDSGTWGSTGDKFYRIDMKGQGRFVNFKFDNNSIDESFKIYGYNIVSEALDVR